MSKNMTKNKRTNLLKWIRRLIQLGMLSVIGRWSYYGIFRCPFPVPFVCCRYCPVIACPGKITSLFWGFWLSMPISILFFGRMFCSWICPVGLVNQLLGEILPIKIRLKKAFRELAPKCKYIALIIALFLWLFLNNPRWAVPIRTAGEWWTSLKLTFANANDFWLIRASIVLGFVVLSIIIPNVWCRYVCPMGGLQELLKRFSLFRVYKTTECNNCNRCRNICEMGTRPDEANCTNCCDCLYVCPVNAIKIGKTRKGLDKGPSKIFRVFTQGLVCLLIHMKNSRA